MIAVTNNIIDLVDDESNEKRVVKRGRDRKWIKYQTKKVHIIILF